MRTTQDSQPQTDNNDPFVTRGSTPKGSYAGRVILAGLATLTLAVGATKMVDALGNQAHQAEKQIQARNGVVLTYEQLAKMPKELVVVKPNQTLDGIIETVDPMTSSHPQELKDVESFVAVTELDADPSEQSNLVINAGQTLTIPDVSEDHTSAQK